SDTQPKVPSYFAKQLLQLNKNVILTKLEQIAFTSLVDYLLEQMQLGHSCITVAGFLNSLPGKSYCCNSIMDIVNKSNLCGFYQLPDKTIKPYPLTALINQSVKNQKVTDDTLIYLTRYLHYELSIANKLLLLNNQCYQSNEGILRQYSIIAELSKNGFPNNEQLDAIRNSALNQLSFVTGGPGTGKTTTIIMLLLLLIRVYNKQSSELKIEIVAPTGKAAIRVKESIESNLSRLIKQFNVDNAEVEILNQLSYSTIHKLLGFKHGSIYCKHNETNPLITDILIIDEASMISLPLMYKLLLAVNHMQIKYIIFLGDKNQLSSVEEGYVFATLTSDMQNLKSNARRFTISRLDKSNRNLGNIAVFADAILNNDFKQIDMLVSNKQFVLFAVNQLKQLIHDIISVNSPLDKYLSLLANFIFNPVLVSPNKLFESFNDFVILCATNTGLLGVDNINLRVETYVKQKLAINSIWYTGRPILILENNATLGLFNGDVGICVMIKNKPMVVFSNAK
ncbi:MAG: AAA family ATPase, partial [Burkholderiales bacterium]|nr:AAA family ATPase [Burkholderiales bacterium]